VAYFLFLLAFFFLAGLHRERDMGDTALARFCTTVFAAFFIAGWISLFGLVGYILLG
jgi:hypothetical protein